jgi:DDE superfamily endonuclease
MGCLAPCFARVEPRRQARKYATGLMGDLPRKNCWTLAEQAGDATPDKMQRLLERAAWDASQAMREVRAFAVARLRERLPRCWCSMSPGRRRPASTPPG